MQRIGPILRHAVEAEDNQVPLVDVALPIQPDPLVEV